jgi:hypothetical protein
MEFPFVRDGQLSFLEVERDDGALIRFHGPGKTQPPHDLVHDAVECELDLGWPPPRGWRAEPQRRKREARVR